MTAAAKDAPLQIEEGVYGAFAAGAVKIYQGVMVGIARATGYARAYVSGDFFAGHCMEQCDNSAGSAGDKKVQVRRGRYCMIVAISGVAVTDIGCPVYASDDSTYTLLGTSGYVGRVVDYVASGYALVEFDPFGSDDFGDILLATREVKSANYTIDIQDAGKVIFVDTDAVVITLPATVAGLAVTIVNAAAYGAAAISASPNASDKIQGIDISSADNKDLINTKATARRGDFVTLVADGTDGWIVTAIRGVWARE